MEGQETTEKIPKVQEFTEQLKIAAAVDYIEEKKHLKNANLPCISIKPLNDTKYFCGICSVESSSEIDLKIHVKGLRHKTAQKKYGCNNISVQDDSKYYCGCCDYILANRQLAFDHIKEEKHKINSNLPCISIKLLDINEYHCIICNVDISSEIDLFNHVNRRRHESAQNNYGCNNVSLKEDNSYYCGWCDCTLKNRKYASDHIENKHMNNVDLPCISIIAVDLNSCTYHCTICDVVISGQIHLKNHVKNGQHAKAQKNCGCDNISRKEDNSYYCRCCEFVLSNREIASQHIKERTHINALKVLKKEGQSTIKTNPNVAKTTKQPNIEPASDSIKEEKHTSNAHLYCICIKLSNDKMHFCRICNVKSSGEIDFKMHVNGLRHKTAQKKYGCNNIVHIKGDLYYCRSCNFALANRKVAFQHIKEEKHMDALKVSKREGQSTIKTTPNAAESTNQPKIKLASDSIKEEKHTTNEYLHCISIKPLKDKKYFCGICHIKIFGEIDLKTHVKGLRHKKAQNEYGCNNISVQKDSKYYCGYCDHILADRQLAFNHIKEKKHKINSNLPCISIMQMATNTYHCRICDIDLSNQDVLESHVNGKRHKGAQWNYRCDHISFKSENLYFCGWCNCTLRSRTLASEHIKGEKHQSNANLLCISINLVNVNEFHCRICDIKGSNRTYLGNHVNGAKHIKAKKKYGCNNIVHKKDNLYYCRCCNFALANREIAFQHIKEEKHMSIVKLLNNEDQPTRKEIPKIAESTNQPKIISEPISKNLLYSYILKNNATDFYCAVCNYHVDSQENIEVHAKQNHHITAMKQFSDNKISLDNCNFFYCEYCSCKIFGFDNAHQHMKGYRHAIMSVLNKLVAKNQEQITSNTIPMKVETKKSDNVSALKNVPNLKTTSSSVSSKLKISENRFSKVTPKDKSDKTRRSKKSCASQKIGAETDEIRCSVCNASLEGATNLHIHLAGHFSNDFISSDKNKKSTEQEEVTKTKTTSQFKLIEDRDCNEKAVKRMERKINMKKIIMDLDFDAKRIYSMEDKSADIKLGMQLCYPFDKENTYCFVCQTKVEISMQDYHQHLTTKEHCEYLDSMEKDHSLFDPFPDQFSQLDLALQYLIETENDFVYCFICDLELNNIQQHIYEKNHNEKCVQLHINAEKNFENVKLIGCDWYKIQFYWCVPCLMRFQSEIKFAKHLKSQIHADCMKEKQNKKRKLIFDFCAHCALLWYGYRCTSAYHEHVQTHMWLKRDGHYSSTEIPESAKLLLINPEDYVNKTIKYFDDISAKERAKEEMLVRDIEKSVESKFRNAKAYTFGSRVSGLGSPDSDIDIFLDCGNMYDGESSSMDRILNYMMDVHKCLSEEPHLWDVEELLTMCRSPIIRALHRITGLSCDISFENGLAVENTLLIKSFNDIFPSCRKMILIIKEWLKLCELSGSDRITSYAIYWYVIFYLQTESILPSIATLIRMKNESHIIAGWEVGVSRDFTSNALNHNFSIKELLIRFFKFYANFDYRRKVACPLISEVIAKRMFTDPESLPEAMGPYKAHVKNPDRNFRIDSVMCIQDPFDLQHNLSKAVNKVYLNRFIKYCLKSLDVLYAF